ncbi:MAG: HEAT repeat domain-containing protein, partial [Myxococcales bacterium]|nr:HEAT repeat domain-containing protein [Myxococcales bacterium]
MTKFGPHVEQLAAVAASGSGRLVAIGGYRDSDAVETSRVHLLSAPKWSPVSIELRSAASALAFAGDLLIVGGSDGALTGYDAQGEEPSRRFRGEGAHEGAVLAIACRTRDEGDASSSDLVATAGEDGVLRLYQLAGGIESAGTRKLSSRPLRAVAIDPDGRYVAAAGDDGVIRSVPLDSEQGFEGAAVREMPCGEGGIGALCFPGDGRVVAGCGDGSIRVCFLEGAVDEENRSGDAAHSAAVRALIYSARLTDKADRELERRLLSVSEDGTVKAWQLDSRRKPRTTEVSSLLRGAALLSGSPRAKADKRGGTLAVIDDKRQLHLYQVSETAELASPETLLSELARLAEDLRASKDEVREAAVKALSELPEDAARVLLDRALSSDKKPEIRRLAAKHIGAGGRRLSRPALRTALDDGDVDTRRAAFEALLAIEKDAPLAALKAALGSKHEGIRLEAVKRLPALRDVSPLVPGLIADRLRDDHKRVRAAALDALSELEPPQSLEPIRVALARGPEDVRAEAVTRLGLGAESASSLAAEQSSAASDRAAVDRLLEGALDDADDKVRSVAFLVSLATRASLSARLKAADQHTAKALAELEKRGAFTSKQPADTINDADLEPLFAAIASRSADTALRGARCLALLGDSRAVGALLQLSREPDAAMRRYVVEALTCAAKRMPGDDRVVTRLSWLLDDADATVRHTAFEALAELAKPDGARGELELGALALRGGFDDTRVSGLSLLVKFGGDGEHAKATSLHARADALLGDALDDEAAQVRAKALATLKTWHSKDIRVALERAAASRHADIRRKVVGDLESRKEGWARELLLSLCADASADVGLAAYKAATKNKGDAKRPEPHLSAMSSPRPSVRAAGAKGCVESDAAALRKRLVELLDEEHGEVFIAAIEAIDKLLPDDQQAFALAFSSIFYELRVRAGELCGKRRDRRAVEPMKKLLTLPKSDINRPSDALRQRAARAVADVGDPAAITFYVALLDDEDSTVREMGGRGLATACRPGEEQPLVDALSHGDLAVRSWAAEGLAKLGDPRAIPVLAGTQRHEHRPIRIGALLSFVALGPDGVRGILQGLEDADREIQDLVFAVIVARDVALARAGLAPDLLLSALSSAHPEIRFAAARALEARIAAADGTAGAEELGVWASELVGPQKLERVSDMKDWPQESEQAALRNVVVSALASDHPALRYAAAQVLALRGQPLAYFREAARLRGPSGEARWVPHTNWEDGEARAPRKRDWVRRIFGAGRSAAATAPAAARGAESSGTLRALAAIGVLSAAADAGQGDDSLVGAGGKRLVFGTFAGLVRQAPPSGDADETHRVRRDALARLAVLGADGAVGRDAVLPVIRRALSDPNHLVRKAALAALRELYEADSLEPLALALEAEAADVGRGAVDELLAAAQSQSDATQQRASALVKGALEAPSAEVRRYALERLPRLYEQGSLEPWLLALECSQADVRLAVVDRLIDARDERVAAALGRALESDHEDLRMKAAVALARRGDARTVDVLAGFLRSEEARQLAAAIEALVELARAPRADGDEAA